MAKATPTAAPALTAKDVRELLAVRYAPPEWRLEHELTLRTRRLDVVALCMWGGHGRAYQVLGFEIKVSRADWLRELGQIEKAAEWAQVVDRFFVVAPKGVVHDGELPRDWGLLEITGTGGGLRLKAHPAQRAIGATLPRELTSRLLTRDDSDRRARDNADIARAQQEAEDRARHAVAAELEGLRMIAATHRELMRDAGLGAYADPVRALRAAQRIEDAVARLERNDLAWPITRITELAEQLTTRAKQLQEAVAEFRAPFAEPPPQSDVTT